MVIYLYFTKTEEKINFNELPLPLEFWIPERYSYSVNTFITIHFISSLNITFAGFYAFIHFGSVNATAGSIILDLKLFCVSLNEIDKYVLIKYFNDTKYNSDENDNVDKGGTSFYFDYKYTKTEVNSKKLKLYSKYLIMQHKTICR